MKNPDVEAIFGLHVVSNQSTGTIGYRSGADGFGRLLPRLRARHADATPPTVARRRSIVVGSQIVLGLQTIVSRRLDITREPSVVTVGVFQGGVRNNIIPDEVKLEGTIRTFDEEHRTEIQDYVKQISEMIAAAGGASAHVHIRRDTT